MADQAREEFLVLFMADDRLENMFIPAPRQVCTWLTPRNRILPSGVRRGGEGNTLAEGRELDSSRGAGTIGIPAGSGCWVLNLSDRVASRVIFVSYVFRDLNK